MPVAIRGERSIETSRSGTGRAAALALPARPPAAPARAGARSSTSEFHSPQAGHWPCHLGLAAPQAEQEKMVAGRGMGGQPG
jgi:hypothetical protein